MSDEAPHQKSTVIEHTVLPEDTTTEKILVEPQNTTTPPITDTSSNRKLKKGVIYGLIGGGVVLVGTVIAAVFAYQTHALRPISCTNDCPPDSTIPQASANAVPTATPSMVARALDGTLVASGTENLKPLAVMIENHPDARPQSGLGSANWVYEAIAEGGITRFMALFANPETANTRVGPIRSVRTYYLDYAREYNAFLSHVGGNIDALDDIQSRGGVVNMDQFAIGEPTYKRDFSRNVATEHTMYSSTSALFDYAKAKAYETKGTTTALPFGDDIATDLRPSSQSVTIDFSDSSFAVRWDYAPATNSYTRYMAGAIHKDAVTNQAILAKNIILQTVTREAVVTRINEHGWKYTLTGSGKAVIIQNGKAIQATWKRTDNNRTRYYSADGAEISLVRGTTWVEVIHPDTKTTY